MRDVCCFMAPAQVSSRPERPVFPGDDPQIKSESVPTLRLPTGSLPGQGFNVTSRAWPMVTPQPCPRRKSELCSIECMCAAHPGDGEEPWPSPLCPSPRQLGGGVSLVYSQEQPLQGRQIKQAPEEKTMV